MRNPIKRLIPFILAFSFLASSGNAIPISQNGKYGNAGLKEVEVQQFFKALQTAVDKHDKQAVAAMVNYPIVVISNGRRQSIKTEAAMVKNYDYIFDKHLSDFLVQTKLADLWSKSEGVATPGGELWFSGVTADPSRPEKYEVKIIAINGMTH